MNYTEEQIKNLINRMEQNSFLIEVFQVISKYDNEGISMIEISKETSLGAYKRDKAICALEFAGIIYKNEREQSKIYKLTEEGKTIKNYFN